MGWVGGGIVEGEDRGLARGDQAARRITATNNGKWRLSPFTRRSLPGSQRGLGFWGLGGMSADGG